MMATLATGVPPQHHYTRAYLSSMPKDDEVLVLQAPNTPFAKISDPTWHGTHHAVALPVENFSFSLPINHRCCHDPHHQSAAATKHSPVPPPAPTISSPTNTPTATHSSNMSDDFDTMHHRILHNLQVLQALKTKP